MKRFHQQYYLCNHLYSGLFVSWHQCVIHMSVRILRSTVTKINVKEEVAQHITFLGT